VVTLPAKINNPCCLLLEPLRAWRSRQEGMGASQEIGTRLDLEKRRVERRWRSGQLLRLDLKNQCLRYFAEASGVV